MCKAQTPNTTPASGTGTGAALTNGALISPSVAGEAAAPASMVKGFNFSLNSSSQHSSVNGWSEIMTPDLSFRFNRHLSVDGSIPWYWAAKNFIATTVKSVTTYPLIQDDDDIGDATVSGHIDARHKDFGYSANAVVGFPTGNYEFGLSANTTTYNISNNYNYSIWRFTPYIDFGEGNSSALAHTVTKKAYTAVGQAANFEGGSSIDLPLGFSFDISAYEIWPIGNQNIYGTVTTKGKNGKTTTTQVLLGQGIVEDNGVNAELDLPISANLSLFSSYQRSLIQGTDIVNIGMTWILRTPKNPAAAAH
jgi:hypothetical protein